MQLPPAATKAAQLLQRCKRVYRWWIWNCEQDNGLWAFCMHWGITSLIPCHLQGWCELAGLLGEVPAAVVSRGGCLYSYRLRLPISRAGAVMAAPLSTCTLQLYILYVYIVAGLCCIPDNQ